MIYFKKFCHNFFFFLLFFFYLGSTNYHLKFNDVILTNNINTEETIWAVNAQNNVFVKQQIHDPWTKISTKMTYIDKKDDFSKNMTIVLGLSEHGSIFFGNYSKNAFKYEVLEVPAGVMIKNVKIGENWKIYLLDERGHVYVRNSILKKK